MKIGFDAKRAFYNHTGLGNYSRYVLNALEQYQPQNQYVAYSPHSVVSGLYRFFPSLWRSYGIVEQLQNDNIAIYHGLSNEIPYCLQKTKIKSVVTIHDLIFLRYPALYPAIDRFFYNQKFRYACQNADLIVAVSEQTKQDIIEFYKIDSRRIKVVYQDCDVAFQQKNLKTKLATKPYILSVGTIEYRKNQLSLVKAFYEANLPDASLLIVGKATNYQRKIEQFISDKSLQNRVKILNNVPFSELPTLYQSATAFAYLSVFEGFGIPIVEALHSETPILAATGSCLEEAGGGGGLYVSPYDISQIAQQLTTLWNDETLRNKLVEAGKNHVQQFSAKRIAEQLNQIYAMLIYT